MAVVSNSRVLYLWVFTIFVVAVSMILPSIHAVDPSAPSPAPAATSDGTSIDQGIAYVLMLLALALTYLIH